MSRRTVFAMELSSALFKGAERLTALGVLMQQLAQAHAGRGWGIEQTAGWLRGSVWAEDVQLMNALRLAVSEARAQRAEGVAA